MASKPHRPPRTRRRGPGRGAGPIPGSRRRWRAGATRQPQPAIATLTKSIMHESLLEVYDRTKVTIFFITHDLEEAIFLGDRVYVVTTRPCRLKKIVDVRLPRPRNYQMLSTEEFWLLVSEINEAVHEEAIRAFQSG